MKHEYMKDKFLEYLGDIGVEDMHDKKIDTFLGLYKDGFGGEPEVIFVSEYVTPDGSREYSSLWFFNEKECVEAKDFLWSDGIDIAPIDGRVDYLRMQKEAYTYENATDKSRLYVRFRSDSGFIGELRASGKNCNYLWRIMTGYLRPNMKRMVSAG